MKGKLLFTLLSTTCFLTAASAAIPIGFESGEGYSVGDLARPTIERDEVGDDQWKHQPHQRGR